MNLITLSGCHPTPLAGYLKALGIFRIVAQQKDPTARCFWQNDTFVLQTALTQPELEEFFLREYQPTPMLSPWNGGSGFHPKDAKQAIQLLEQSTVERFAAYRQTILAARKTLEQYPFTPKKGKNDESDNSDESDDANNTDDSESGVRKQDFLEACRNAFPEQALIWLDTVCSLTADGPEYPPLLGSGGNDGRLEFSQNFMQRITELFDTQTGHATSTAFSFLQAALYGRTAMGLWSVSIGQFYPGHAGGSNASTGFDGSSVVNPWDFILMMEGSMLFMSATTRKMMQRSPGVLSYPFTVRPSCVGYGSADSSDGKKARAEMWLPLWNRSAALTEISALFSEGRAQVGPRMARHGLDFAQAVSSLGVDRGISEFVRYAFLERNGKAYFAVPLGRLVVSRQPRVDLLSEIDLWLDIFRTKASSGPASIQRVLRQLEEAIFALCQFPDSSRTQRVLIALGQCQRDLGKSFRWATSDKVGLRPLRPLSPQWLDDANDNSVEWRLAVSLASLYHTVKNPSSSESETAPQGSSESAKKTTKHTYLRYFLDPVAITVSSSGLEVHWRDNLDRDLTWHDGDIFDVLCNTMQRRWFHINHSDGDRATFYAHPSDLADWIEGRVDIQRFQELLWGCLLTDWPRLKKPAAARPSFHRAVRPDDLYTLFKLCFPGHTLANTLSKKNDSSEDATRPQDSSQDFSQETRWQEEDERDDGIVIPLVPAIYRYLVAGNVAQATQMAVRRLRGSGLHPRFFSAFRNDSVYLRRLAASLLFPIHPHQLQRLAQGVLVLPKEHDTSIATESLDTLVPE